MVAQRPPEATTRGAGTLAHAARDRPERSAPQWGAAATITPPLVHAPGRNPL